MSRSSLSTSDTPRRTSVMLLGCGDLGTGVAVGCFRVGFRVAIVERPQPLAVRRASSFSEAARCGQVEVAGVVCEKVNLTEFRQSAFEGERIQLVTASFSQVQEALTYDVLVDARMAKSRLQGKLMRHPLIVALGPGHVAGEDCHCVIETQRGPQLGRLIWKGAASPDTGIPGEVGGHTKDRVLRSPGRGELRLVVGLGAQVKQGQILGHVGSTAVRASLSGLLRGVLADGDKVVEGQKLGDIDPRSDPPPLASISDKALCVGSAVVKAIQQHFGEERF